MAAKLGFEAIKYVLKKVLTKKGVKGIATIPGKAYDMRMGQLVDEMTKKMRALGYDINKVTEKEVQGLLDSAEALAKQKKPKVISQGDPEFQGITDKLLGKQKPTTESLLKGEKYTDEQGRVWDFNAELNKHFQGANLKVVPQTTVDEHITFIKSKEPIESMKEANKLIKREGRYKNLTNEESKKILKDTEDHIFERDIQYDEFGDPIKPEPEDFQSGGLAYMLGEPNTRIEALQHAGVIADPRGLYTDPSIYSKGESEVQNYYAGGGVGQGPWTKGIAPGTPEQPPQPETPIHHAQGRPDPLKAPRGLPSVAPRNMDPAYMQQKMMQQAMMSRGNTGQGPRSMAAEGGIMRMGFKKGGDMSRRGFMKLLAGIAALPVIGKYFKAAKLAKPAAAVTETIARGADGMPTYINDLITVVKAKGTRDVIEGFKKTDYSTVHSYKGVDVVEHPSGATTIKKGKETSVYGSDEPGYHEIEMEIIPGEFIQKGSPVSDEAAKAVKEADQYAEYTAKPDMDGKLKDVEEYIDDLDHLELKEIADEVNPLRLKMYNEDAQSFKKIKKTKKASGGLAHMLGE